MTEAMYITAGSLILAIVLGFIIGWFLKKSFYKAVDSDVVESFERQIKDKDQEYNELNKKFIDMQIFSEKIEGKNREFVEQSVVNSEFLRDSQKKNSELTKEILILKKTSTEDTEKIEYHEMEQQKSHEIIDQYKSDMKLKENEHDLLKAEIANNATKVDQSENIITLFNETYKKIKNI